MPHYNVKVPLNLWDSQDGYPTGVKNIIIDSIHKNKHLGVIINFTVSVFHQSTGNNILDLVQVRKLLGGEAPLLTIIGEATQLDLKLGGHVSDIVKTDKEVIEYTYCIVPILNLGGRFSMYPNCIPPKDIHRRSYTA